MATKSSKKSALSLPTVKELLEAGVHFGHEKKRWNPRFAEYVYNERGGFHIIDLEKTLVKLKEAGEFLRKKAKGGDIIFVGTKRQARDIVKDEAIRCGAHFVINRWVGGLLTNFETIHKGIKKLREVEKKLQGDITPYNQQQLSVLRREWGRFDRVYGGVKNLDEVPDVVVVIDAHFERITVREARSQGIPIVALVDSNTDPGGIDYSIPGNDDAIKSIKLFVNYLAECIIIGNKGKGVEHVFVDLSRVGVREEKEGMISKGEVIEPKISRSSRKRLTRDSKIKREERIIKKEVKAKSKIVKVKKKSRGKKKKIVKKSVKSKSKSKAARKKSTTRTGRKSITKSSVKTKKTKSRKTKK